jgi:hypothetical protein
VETALGADEGRDEGGVELCLRSVGADAVGTFERVEDAESDRGGIDDEDDASGKRESSSNPSPGDRHHGLIIRESL